LLSSEFPSGLLSKSKQASIMCLQHTRISGAILSQIAKLRGLECLCGVPELKRCNLEAVGELQKRRKECSIEQFVRKNIGQIRGEAF